MASAAPASKRWLFGPVPDLLLGCGLGYALLFVLAIPAGAELRGAQPLLLFPLLVLLCSMPHYGATLLRVYEERSSRRAYAVFSVWATLAVAVAFVAGAYHAGVAAALFTIYLTWSPWHYTGQNYGLAVMFLGRRGVPVEPDTKRWLYASFVLSYGLVLVMMHARVAVDRPLAQGAAPFGFLALGVPPSLLDVLVPVLAAAYVVCLAVAAVRLLRVATPRDLLPTGALVLTQALWFSLPYAAHFIGAAKGLEPIGWGFRPHYLYWIVVGHAVQYLWVTTYYARASSAWPGYARYLGKTAAAGIALWTLPVVFFAPGRLGEISYHTGLALLLVAVLNIHHFILDGAIWKLRDSRIARILIASRPDTPEGAARRAWPRRLVWGVVTAGCAAGVLVFVDEGYSYPRALARGDVAGARAVLDRLRILGRDNFMLRRELRRAERAQQAGHPALREAPDAPRY